MSTAPAYGLWSLALINSAIFIFFAARFGPAHDDGRMRIRMVSG